MPVSKYKTWLTNEVLTSADLNASFDQVFDNQQSLGFPRESSSDFNGFELILDADADSSITVDTDDKLDIRLHGADLFDFDGTAASPVNGLKFTGSATGVKPSIAVKGSDTNISLGISAKGSGTIAFGVNSCDVFGILPGTGTTVNGVFVTGSATGGTPIVSAQGTDSDVQLTLASKGTDPIVLRVGSVDIVTGIVAAGTIVNGFTAVGTATGNPPELRATGSDTNISLKLVPKGSGSIILNTSTVTATPGATAVPIANGSGKLADGWISESSVTQHATAIGVAANDLRLLTSFSPSGASQVDNDNTYVSNSWLPLLIRFELLVSADDAKLYLRTSADNGSSVASAGSDYSYVSHGLNTAGAISSASSGAAQIVLTDATNGVGNASASGEGVTGMIWLRFLGGVGTIFPTVRFETQYLDTSTRSTDVHGTGHRRASAAINFLRLLPSSGTISGLVQVYGYATS